MYARALRLLLTVVFTLGCSDMARPYATPEQWGQERTFPVGSWTVKQPLVVLLRDPTASSLHLPQVNTLVMGVDNDSPGASQFYNLRWSLTHGVGGARVEVRFDAVGYTRIAMPVDGFTLALVVEPYALLPLPPDVPDGIVRAFAMAAVGGIGQDASEGATHTTGFQLDTTAGPGAVAIPVPVGASAFRLVGKSTTGGGISTPFSATTEVSFLQGGTLVASLVGQGAAPADPSLRTLYYSGDWFPLPGSMNVMRFSNTAAEVVRGQFQFKIDI